MDVRKRKKLEAAGARLIEGPLGEASVGRLFMVVVAAAGGRERQHEQEESRAHAAHTSKRRARRVAA
jgi:hypothetical protein